MYFRDRTTNWAKDGPNMWILNFHMFCVSPLPGVFQNILWACQESFKIYFGRGFLSRAYHNILWANVNSPLANLSNSGNDKCRGIYIVIL